MKHIRLMVALIATGFAAAMSQPAFAAEALTNLVANAPDFSTGSLIAAAIGFALVGSLGSEPKTAAELAAETKAAFDKSVDAVREIAEKALKMAETGEKATADFTEKTDNALTAMNTLKAQVADLEQKLARDNGRGDDGMTAGQRVVADEQYKALSAEARWKGRAVFEVKDISSLTTDAAGSVGALIQADRAPGVMLPQRRMTIRALLAPGTTNSSSIEYEKEKVFTNNAAPVAEGASKPQSELQFEDAVATVRTIAHWMRASVQVLADAPALMSIIDQRLRYGLAYKEEVQLLTGDGTGQNLPGLITNATPYAAPGSLVASNPLEVIRLMILQVALSEFPANGIVLNPIDMAACELTKDTTGRYIFADAQGTVAKRLWGLPVVETQAVSVDKALVGAFDLAAQIFDRQNATVEVSTEDGDNFTKNKVTIRAEERLALAIYRPAALVYGDLGRVA